MNVVVLFRCFFFNGTFKKSPKTKTKQENSHSLEILVSLTFWYLFTIYEPEKEKQQFLSFVNADLAPENKYLK